MGHQGFGVLVLALTADSSVVYLCRLRSGSQFHHRSTPHYDRILMVATGVPCGFVSRFHLHLRLQADSSHKGLLEVVERYSLHAVHSLRLTSYLLITHPVHELLGFVDCTPLGSYAADHHNTPVSFRLIHLV